MDTKKSPTSNKPNIDLSKREADIYRGWEESEAFEAGVNNTSKNPFTIMIPPPNVTGSLHVGHALTMTLQDILIRFKRMQGYDALWQPGTDHAGIATQMMVERELASNGITRKDLGREKFIDEVWKWKEQSGGNITNQLRCLGASLDWKKERFTLDNDFSTAVIEAFIKLYNDGLIYRAKRLVNWDSKLRSAISDLEVKNIETKGSMWYIKYPVADTKEFLIVATTRPETLLGDTAVAVNPTDERYTNFIGKYVIAPLTGRMLHIIADDYSDIEKGTGVVKITPAHDFNDFEVGQRHNLPMPTILDAASCVYLEEIKNELRLVKGISDPNFIYSLEGKDSLSARTLIIEELKKLGLIEKIEPHIYQVPYAERGNSVVEPRLTTQWFCNAEQLAEPAIKAVFNGDIKLVPKNWENTFFAWMNNIQPWCISRQLWWGHRIPAWYGPDGKVFVYKTEEEAYEAAQKFYNEKNIVLSQDEDVLDTWFSSSLWPFATLGWPKNTAELNRYYPTDVLVTGFDIIFFWVSRMIMMGIYFMKKSPFHTVFIHGLVLDEHGQKMSKTKGNVIDPLEIMENYGTDTLRWSVCALTGPGRDLKLSSSQILTSRSFITKINNAAIFWQMQYMKPNPNFNSELVENSICRWLLAKMNIAIKDTTEALESFRFDYYTEILYNFIWHTFCDWFIELAKPVLKEPDSNQILETAAEVFRTILKLLHPSIPFITEELWHKLGYGPEFSLIKTDWPQEIIISGGDKALDEINWIISIIISIRSLRAEKKIPAKTHIEILLKTTNHDSLITMLKWESSIKQLVRAYSISELKEEIPKSCAQIIHGDTTIILPFANIIDNDAEKTRIEKEIAKSEAQLKKQSLLLSNKDFMSRASGNIIEEKQEQIKYLKLQIAKLQEALRLIN